MDGYQQSVKAVMRAAGGGRLRGIIGPVAGILSVRKGYEIAIETALGFALQNIVVQDQGCARAAITFLKEERAGRATFLPLDTVQRRGPNREEKALAKLPGILGYAVDLIGFKPEAENAVRFLLGRVLIAENIDAALAAAKAGRYRLRVVTLDGDVVNAGGSMSGGSKKHKEGYLSRNVEIAQAAAQVKQLHAEMLSWQEKLEELEATEENQKEQLQQLAAQLRQQQLKADRLKLNLEQVQQQKTRDNERLLLLLDDRSNITAAYMANRDKVKELRAAVTEREGQDTQAKELLDSLKKEIAKYGSAVTALDNQLQDAQITLQTSAARTQDISKAMHSLDQDTLRLQEEIAANQKEQERRQQEIADCDVQKQRLQQQSDELLAQLQQILGGKDDFAQERGSLLDKQQDIEKEIAGLRKQVNESEAQLKQTELDLARHESNCGHIREQLQQDYQMDEAAARGQDFAELQEMDLAALQKQESRLTLQIADLGPINAAAIEEYNAVKERSEFLCKQYNDLCTAKDNLEAVIAEINSGMTKRFKEAFAKINEYFAQCYVKIFGGGTAVLRLTEPDNLLDSGIDIDVQPPGKKLQSLYLMSGGRKSTDGYRTALCAFELSAIAVLYPGRN